jgi:hypothetical protein
VSGFVDRSFRDTPSGFGAERDASGADGAGNQTVPGRLGQVTTFEQQERWQARARLRFDPADEAFWTGGLFDCLDGPGVAVIVLPADCLAQPVDFGDDLPGIILPDRFSGLTANGVSSLYAQTTTSSAVIRYAPGDGDGAGRTWRAFVALDRNGGAQAGIGGVARYPAGDGRHAGSAPALHLFMLAHLIRVVVETQAKVLDWAANQHSETRVDGPFELVVVVPFAFGMALGGLNDGWQEPHVGSDPPRSREKHVVVRLQFEAWPYDLRSLMFRALDRACEGFGNRRKPYLSVRAPDEGIMSGRYA